MAKMMRWLVRPASRAVQHRNVHVVFDCSGSRVIVEIKEREDSDTVLS
jgi:hypothetical protein